nr:MAG TPA: hypothetical protein [Caudoviricetes sp.]
MEKIAMTITAETMDRAREILARTTGRQFRELKVEYEALLVAEGKSRRIKSRPQAASSSDQSSTSTPSTSS